MWLSVDPLAEKFPGWSPYSYCFNNPLSFVDPDGRAPDDWKRNINGQVVYDKTLTSTSPLGFGETYLGETYEDVSWGALGPYTHNYYQKNGNIVSFDDSIYITGDSSDSPTAAGMFLNGLCNTTLGIVGALSSGAYCIGTEGVGAALGGGLAFTLSCGEIGIGLSQMGDAFSMKPDKELHNNSTIPGLIAAKQGSEYAPLIDGISGFATGSLSGGNVKGTINAVKEIGQNKDRIINGANVIDATLDTKGVIDGGKSAYETYKKNN
jgi:hypothetical protein